MTRDMKQNRRRSDNEKKGLRGSTLLGIFGGIVVGVLIAAGVVWYINKTPTPFTAKGQRAAPTEPGKTQEAPTPAALPGKPGDPAPQGGDKPRFDFYKILPGSADSIPAPSEKPAEKSSEKPTDDNKSKGDKESVVKNSLYLQTGSFQKPEEADNQKAKLALMGVEASVQQVMVQDKVWFRVRLGPFNKLDDVNRVRSELAKQNIEANVVKKD